METRKTLHDVVVGDEIVSKRCDYSDVIHYDFRKVNRVTKTQIFVDGYVDGIKKSTGTFVGSDAYSRTVFKPATQQDRIVAAEQERRQKALKRFAVLIRVPHTTETLEAAIAVLEKGQI